MLVVMLCVVRFFSPFTTYALSCGKDAVWLGLSRGGVYPSTRNPMLSGRWCRRRFFCFLPFVGGASAFLSALFASTVAHLTEQKRIRYDLLQALAP